MLFQFWGALYRYHDFKVAFASIRGRISVSVPAGSAFAHATGACKFLQRRRQRSLLASERSSTLQPLQELGLQKDFWSSDFVTVTRHDGSLAKKSR